jgi:hypothetical protein
MGIYLHHGLCICIAHEISSWIKKQMGIHVATMFAFCSMVMTYFGVNYYLSGLHSYAAGDPVPVPAWVYIGLATMLALSIASYIKFKALTKK